MDAGDTLHWQSDAYASYGGFVICAEPAEPWRRPPRAPPSPAPPPSWPPGAAPPLSFYYRSSGHCERPITSIALCEQAGAWLQLGDVEADEDEQNFGVRARRHGATVCHAAMPPCRNRPCAPAPLASHSPHTGGGWAAQMYDPPWCFLMYGRLTFNQGTNEHACTPEGRCLCIGPAAPPPPRPPSLPSSPPAAPGALFDVAGCRGVCQLR